jgi:hypothetical protein
MDSALVVLVIVVALVAIDMIGRRGRPAPDETSRTHKIVVDLSERDRE